MPKHRKQNSNGAVIVISSVTIIVALLLTVGVVSAVSFARPTSEPPTEAKFSIKVVTDSDQLVTHPRPAYTVASHIRKSVIAKRGDTLSSIAAKVFGNSRLWPILWWNARNRVHNPNNLPVGTRLGYGKWDYVRPWLSRRALAAIPKPKPTHIAAAPTSTEPVASTPAAQPATTTYSGGSGFQSCVIARESGGNPHAVNPTSGAGGLYQFLPSTWHALGFSGLPQDASVATQNAAFAKAYAESGTSPWRPYDGC